jgi:ribosomal protein S19
MIKYDTRINRISCSMPPPERFRQHSKDAQCHTYLRSARISKEFLDKRVAVYNGNKFLSFVVKPWMINHKFGEFVLTKKLGTIIHKRKDKKSKRK